MIYFDKKIKKEFTRHHAVLIKASYKNLGMPAPDFATLSRKRCLQAVNDFINQAKSSTDPKVKELKIHLEKGLRDLLPSHIPANWT